LFLALASTISAGDKVAIVQPDYFANRKLVQFLDGEVMPVSMDYLGTENSAGLDISELENAFRAGAKVLSSPTRTIRPVPSTRDRRSKPSRVLPAATGFFVIVDQLYARLLYGGAVYTHLRSMDVDPNHVMTIMGPSKTESLSGYRLGVAFGSPAIVARMEKLQAIVSLRAAGYSQSALKTWFAEPEGWLAERVRLHQLIRDDLHSRFVAAKGVVARVPQAGKLFVSSSPKLSVPHREFVHILRHQAEVIVTPGTEFGPQSGDSIRLNFSQPHQAAVAALDRIVELLGQYRA